MADQNSSNKRPMNSVADDIDYSSTLTELERIGQRASRKGINRVELEQRIKGQGQLLNSLLEEGRRSPIIKEGPFYDEQVSNLRSNIKQIRTQMNTLDTSARTRAESEAATYIQRQFGNSAINSQVSTIQREAATQNRAFSMMGQSYDELESKRQNVLADIRVRERGAINEVKGMYSGRGEVVPEKSAALGVMMAGAQGQFRELATLNAAQVLQRTQGSDPNSRLKRLGDMGQSANELLKAESIAQELKSGGVNISAGGSMKKIAGEDINTEILNQARVLSQALKELADGANKTDEELSKLRSTADEAAENMDKLKQAAGAGGGNSNTLGYLQAAGGAFMAAGGAAQQILVAQRMQQTANIGGFANLANQQYDMYKKARSGDIASQLALGQFGNAADFGTEMQVGTNVASTAYAAGAATQVAAGGIKVASTINPAENVLSTSAAQANRQQGMLDIAQGGANLAVTGMDIKRQTSARAARLAGIQANMQARMAVQAVGAEQAQGLRDMYTGLDVVGQGMGANASGFIDNARSSANLEKMANSRMSPEQFVQAAQLGVDNIGSTFNMDQIYASRNLERGGFGSVQTNMQRMATLASAGANNPKESMEVVLTAAVTAGLQGSKAINDMVNNTAVLASSSVGAAMGMDTTGTTASMLGAQMDSNMSNKAASAQEIARNLTTNEGISWSGMVNTSRINKMTGLDGTDAIFAQKLDTATLKDMLNMSKEKRDEALLNRGVNFKASKMESSEALVKKLLEADQFEILEGGGSAFGINMDVAGIQKKLKQGKALTAEERASLGKAAVGAGFADASAMERSLKGIDAPVNSGKGQNLTAGKDADGNDINNIKKQMDNLRTSGFQQLTQAAITASNQLEKFGGALKVFTDLQNKFEKEGMKNENEFTGAAAKFATDFSASIGRFDTATDKYQQASAAIIKAVGLNSNGIPVISDLDFNNGKNQKKGSQAPVNE